MTHSRCGGSLVPYTGPGQIAKPGFHGWSRIRFEVLVLCEKCRLVGIEA